MSFLSLLTVLQAPQSFWPESVTGWITVVGFVGTVTTLLWQRSRKEAQDTAHADQVTRDLTLMRQDITADINGLGQRVTKNREDLESMNVVITGMLQTQATLMAESKNTNAAVGRIEQKLDGVLTRFFAPASPS
jgi:hypothetical protein